MHTITRTQVTPSGPAKLTAEASTLGLEPGEWPIFIHMPSERLTFQRGVEIRERGEFAGYLYLSQDGILLTVVND